MVGMSLLGNGPGAVPLGAEFLAGLQHIPDAVGKIFPLPSSRYENIDRCKEEPAFVKRHATFITQSGSSRKAVVRDTELDAATPAESHSEDLFD